MKGLMLLLLCILSSAGASSFLKVAASDLGDKANIWSMISSPMIWLGGGCYIASFLGYIYVLRQLPLSLAQPTITVGVSVIASLVAVSFLKEQMSFFNWAGLTLACVGVVLLSLGRI